VSVPAGNVAAPEPAASTVDARNPWLGLASFTEETREYFYGREDEVAELARRVQRKLLTVLFGQSGLGKTSILRAGLVPRLRGQGYCPVYVRIDYARAAPEPAEQIKQAIARTARRSGQWTQAGVAVEGESLWEFLHHRDDVLHDESGATLIPLLIFDQFEEIFTLAQTDDFGRARAARFIADLADLVENRPPKELEARLDADDSAAERFDFARSDYRVLIALREDYLAPLEGLKASMPSITQNRLRLAPMTGQQALAAVLRPGQGLVSEEVAEAIVRFVAGGAELANAEVEPSLLSLICRELNDTRLAQGRAEISLDLLAGSHATILSNFYERSLADQPAAVRRIIEDELLTESGFRENVAEERVLTSFAAAGAAPETLATLVNRRLLRIEERLDVRRVELTHDVLCSVVKQSRDLRQEREARDASERLLAEQRDRARAARHALVRARQIALACAVLAVGAVAAAAYGYLSTERARRAEAQAQATRVAAEKARSEAEHLLGYLNDDFATELEGFGRLGLVLDLGRRELDYYKSLPVALQTKDTIRSAALAKVRYGVALQMQSRLAEAEQVLGEAVQALKQLRAGGDDSERTAIGLSLGIGALGDVADRQGKGGLALATESEAVLRPYYDAANASAAVRRAYGLMVESYGTYKAMDLASLERAKEAFASLGARDLSDVQAAADYAQAASFEGETLYRSGRIDELEKVEGEAETLAGRVLDIRPGHLVALRARNASLGWLSAVASERMHAREALQLMVRSSEDAATLVRLDPTHADDRQSLGDALHFAGEYLLTLGRTRAAIAYLGQAAEVAGAEKPQSPFNLNFEHFLKLAMARERADLGEDAAAGEMLASAQAVLERIHRDRPAESMYRVNADGQAALVRAEIARLRGDPAAKALMVEATAALARSRGNNFSVERVVEDRKVRADALLADVEYSRGEYAAAFDAARAAVERAEARHDASIFERRRSARAAVQEAMALARLGRREAAARILAPAVKLQRELYARNRDDEEQRLELAATLYAEALTDPDRHGALLAEAAGIIAALPAEMRGLRSVGVWSHRIEQERRGPA